MNFNLCSRASKGVDSFGGHGVTAAATWNSRRLWRLNSIKDKARFLLLTFLFCAGFATTGWAKEIMSNGRGGGLWSSPGAWRGNAAPGPADTVIVKTNDTIVFDGNYPERTACGRLQIDAGGRLNFKEETAPHILSVAGRVEVRGQIHINLTRFPQGMAEIRLLADKEAERIVHVASNAVFDAAGTPGLPDGRYNVIISTGPRRPGKPQLKALFKADPGGIAYLADVGFAHMGEYHSNGVGGGNWSDPETWREKIAPAGADLVVIASDDTVVFDGHSPEQPSCRKILIDPRGILTFKTDEQPHVLSVAGAIESYGTIRMDGSKAPLGVMELRLIAETDEACAIRMLPNSALLLNGAEGVGRRKNVVLSTLTPHKEASIVVQDEAMVDIQRAELRDIVLQVSNLDNTGFKANERLNIVGNRFTGQARLALSNCDTPAVRENVFTHEGARPLGAPALAVDACKLVQIRNNVFVGLYAAAIQAQQDVDSSAIGNVVSNAARGICWSGQNAMLRGNTIAGCRAGIVLEGATGVVESATVRGSDPALDLQRSRAQFTDVRVEEMPATGTALALADSEAVLLNCNIEFARIKVGAKAPAKAPWVQTMNYLVVQVKGKRPPHTTVNVRTALASGGPPRGGAADLNVRNSPARLNAEGFSPLPRSLRALIVRSWALGRDGKKIDAPFYDLVIARLDEKSGAPKTLKSMVIEPKDTWYRPDPNQLTATVEAVLP
ncbi:MAG: NosD domain-containing protein [Kiritimatiellia bacterium]|jgi:hypothetical protein